MRIKQSDWTVYIEFLPNHKRVIMLNGLSPAEKCKRNWF